MTSQESGRFPEGKEVRGLKKILTPYIHLKDKLFFLRKMEGIR